MKTCDHCGTPAKRRYAVRITKRGHTKVAMVGSSCAKRFPRANQSDLIRSLSHDQAMGNEPVEITSFHANSKWFSKPDDPEFMIRIDNGKWVRLSRENASAVRASWDPSRSKVIRRFVYDNHGMYIESSGLTIGGLLASGSRPFEGIDATVVWEEVNKLGDVMAEKVGDQRGSNKGGTYRGVDGVDRYVKEYTDPAQASCEHLANKIYADLGMPALNSNVYVDPRTGKPSVYASEILKDVQPLQASGLTKDKAQKFMRGFGADVLVGNWDAVGMSLDNVVVDKAGNVLRVDNGGSFLMRAKAGRKADALLNQISEVDVFLSDKNPSYKQVANAAGIYEPAALKDMLKQQVASITALREKHQGWAGYVNANAPGLNAADKAKIIDMLEARTSLLQLKRDELNRPLPAPMTSYPRPRKDNAELDSSDRRGAIVYKPTKVARLP